MSSTARFIVARLVVAMLFVVAVAGGAFLLVRVAPGDATSDLLLSRAGPEAIAAERARLGLDQPLWTQFGHWIAGLATFDLGQSSRFGRPVAGLVADRMGNTAALAALALMIATAIGLPLGVFTGTRPQSKAARLAAVLSIALVCCPPIIGTLGLLFLAASTGWLSIAPGQILLPALALALPLAALLERIQSQAAAEAFSSPVITAAAARGLPASRLIWVHTSRQSLRPVLGVAGVVIASLFSGSVAVETMTSWPGLGMLTVEALSGRDLYLIAGCALAGAALIATGNLIADILRRAADPRVGIA